MLREGTDEIPDTGAPQVRGAVAMSLMRHHVRFGDDVDEHQSEDDLVNHMLKSAAIRFITTFFILALRKLLTKNLNLSNSVWMMINLKFVFGSMFPV